MATATQPAAGQIPLEQSRSTSYEPGCETRVARTFIVPGLHLAVGPRLTIPNTPIHLDLPKLFTALDEPPGRLQTTPRAGSGKPPCPISSSPHTMVFAP